MQRLLTAIALIVVALYLVFWSPSIVFLIAAGATGALCYREFAFLTTQHGISTPGITGLAIGLLIVFLPELLPYGIPILLVAAFGSRLRNGNLRDVLPGAACALLGAFYTFGPWRFAVSLREQSIHLLFFALALNWVGDSAAYYTGRSLGKHKLAPSVSPGKSIEGAVASAIASALFGLLYLGHFLPLVRPWQVILMALTGNVAGQLGDLVESAIKRGAGVKDSGSALPGHGGVLDRLDSSLFSVPVVYVIVFIQNVVSGHNSPPW